MFDIFMEEKWVTILMMVFLGFSILTRIILGGLFGSMIRETDNMAVTQNRLLRQCKLKFINVYQLNDGVNNVSVFVDRFLSRMTVGPFSLESLYHFSGQTELMFVVTCGVGISRCLGKGKTFGQVMPYYIACMTGLYLYFAISSAVDLKGRQRLLKISLVDYLENHLSSRIGTTRKDLERLRYERPGRKVAELMPEERVERPLVSEEQVESTGDRMQEADRKQLLPGEKEGEAVSEEELEELLKEFLAI